MIAYKLFRLRKDGTLGSLFINRRAVLEKGKWLQAHCHPTKGYAVRPGWHATAKPHAPHLSIKGRIWKKVQLQDYIQVIRPESQGGEWYLANQMKILEEGAS